MKRNNQIKVEEGMKKYRKIGNGSLRLADGRRIKPNELFWALPNSISRTAKSRVEEVDDNDVQRPPQAKPKADKVKKPIYDIKKLDDGMVVLINQNGKEISEPASEELAEQWLASLGNGIDIAELNLHPTEDGKETQTEETDTEEFFKEKVSPGWYVIKDKDGKQMSEGKMREKNADTYIAELKGEK